MKQGVTRSPPASGLSSASAAATAAAPPSFATGFRKRMDPVITAFVVCLMVYSFVTCFAYYKISYADEMAGSNNDDDATNSGGIERNAEELYSGDGSGDADGDASGDGGVGADKAAIYKVQHTFPIHVTDEDREVIAHPGLALAYELGNDVPPDVPLSVTVPKFFDETKYADAYGGSIREYLGHWGERAITKQEALSIGSFDSNGRETIYVSIASYRDFECRPTVEDLYERALYPERIRVAVLDQRAPEDDHCIGDPEIPCSEKPDQFLCKYRHLIDVFEMDARMGVGPVFARHLAHRHYRGEYFSMQLDSHVRFTEHWDEDLVQQWKSAKNEMGVLTTYLSDITNSIDPVTHESKHKTRPIMCESDYEGQGSYKHLRHGQQPEGIPYIRGEPTLHPFWAAGFSFARGHFVIQVPYDQYLPMVFQGEEISLGLRGFTYGYDYYTPERGISFHMYASRDESGKRKKVPLFWENANTYKNVGIRAMKRLNMIIGMANHKPEEWQQDEELKYGLGQVRKKERFFETFGIHTDTQTVEHHLCRFVGQPMMKVFKPALRANGMGIDYDKITFRWKDPEPAKPKEKIHATQPPKL